MTFYELYQYYKNKGAETGEGIESITDTTQYKPIVPQQYQQGGGDGPQGDFGKFGNLLKDTEKTFTKDVYAIDKNMYPGAEMTGSFKPTEVTGYKNATSGIYQTIDGKNINHAGLNIKPAFAYVMDALGLGEPKNLTGLPYKEGYIKGTFTDGIPQNWKDSISNIGNPFKNFNNPFKPDSSLAATSTEDKKGYIIPDNEDIGGGTPGGNPNNWQGTTYDNSGGDFQNQDGSNVSQDFQNTSASLDNYDASALYAEGGRVNFELGGDTNYRVMVTKMFIESGAEDGTGMGIEEFANTYFPLPQMANGGIINSYGY